MKNILSRDEYLKQMNEGVFGDAVRKGISKVKDFFRIGMKKIKNFIAIFDKDGKVLPVVSPQAVIDKFSGNAAVNVYASSDMSSQVKDAGGNGCDSKAPEKNDEGIYDFGPKGKEFAKWMEEKKYKDTVEYKNLMSLPSIVNECYNSLNDDDKKIFESMINEDWDGIVKKRTKYSNVGELDQIEDIDVHEFEEKIDQMIQSTIFNDGKPIKVGNKEKVIPRNILVFGAPGIGKSTIPNLVINKYNKLAAGDSSKEMSLITVDCPNIAVGDFMMPTMPQPKLVQKIINQHPEAFPKAKKYLDNLTPEEEEELTASLDSTKQFDVSYAPQSWLPSYRTTGDDDLDALLDAYANGGVFRDSEGHTHKTGNGGIIMFDEFLRSDPNVFSQMMIFLLTREMGGWKLGSKWVIIACSNRPCDDDEIDEVWGKWNGGTAGKDRFERMFHLTPSPEQWKEWARSKGCDELLLKFIFDESSRSGDEYPRWHSMVKNGSGESRQVLPISPRRWQSAFEFINSYEIDHDFKDISQMSVKEIKKVISGIFDKSFVEEIVQWLEDHMNSVSLDEIIADPVNTYLPEKFAGNDQGQATILVQNIFEQFTDRYKDKMDDLRDDDLANIFLWFGLNYKDDFTTVAGSFITKLPDILNKSMFNYVKSSETLLAAYPERDIEETVNSLVNNSSETTTISSKYPEDTLDVIKEIMRKYFPWRIDGDKIKYYDDLDIEDKKDE